ncbi:MAG: hypothetical protein IPI10_04380 [Bacteroidetes bacterium]|nr:hypothetical protein [Bacteroidota bacterium]
MVADRWDKYSILEDIGKYGANHYNVNVIKNAVDLISNDARGSSSDHYKKICVEVLSEMRETLNKASLTFAKNESRWLKWNSGSSKDEVSLKLADFQFYIEGKQTAITKDK